MTLYDSREEAEANPEDGKRLMKVELNGTCCYAWGRQSNSGGIAIAFLTKFGGSVRVAERKSREAITKQLRAMSREEAIAWLDSLRSEAGK